MLSLRSRPSIVGHPIVREVELAPDAEIESVLGSLKVRRDDKEVFDQLKAWWSIRRGREITQWEAFNLLLAAALEHEEARVPR